MPGPWRTVDRVDTDEGPLELMQRGPDAFLITIAGRVLMNSLQNRSETALAELSCAGLHGAPEILIGGLGMGFTVRAALEVLPRGAKVTVAELNPVVERWCRGPLAALTGSPLEDPRVRVRIADVSELIAQHPGRWSRILIDLYEGPHAATQGPRDPLYGAAALARTRRALVRGGLFAVWSEQRDPAFEQRVGHARFELTTHRAGRGGRRHVVYLARAL